MLIGYVRVSKSDGSQTLDLQKDALIAEGVDPSRIYEDKVSGKQEKRAGLEACLKALQPGNSLIVWKLDRLGRDLKHLINIVEDLRDRDIGFKVLTGQGAKIDTTTSNGRLVFGFFAALAEYERELIVERTHAGLKAARARGRVGGRPRKIDAATLHMAVAALSKPGATVKGVAEKLKIDRTTLYLYMNGDGTLKETGQRLCVDQNKK